MFWRSLKLILHTLERDLNRSQDSHINFLQRPFQGLAIGDAT